MRRKVLMVILSLLICLSMMPAAAFAEGETGGIGLTGSETVYYESFDENGVKLETQEVEKDGYKLINQDVTQATWSVGKYVVDGAVNMETLELSGDVHLILLDGCQLTVSKGISSRKNTNLTIYAGSTDANDIKGTGALNAIGVDAMDDYQGGTGIDISGIFTVNGGNVTATGGKCSVFGGNGIYNGSKCVINGGNLTAIGGKCISVNEEQSSGGTGILLEHDIEINGGEVHAIGGDVEANGEKIPSDSFRVEGGAGISTNYASWIPNFVSKYVMKGGSVIARGGNVKASLTGVSEDVASAIWLSATGGEGIHSEHLSTISGGTIDAVGGNVDITVGEVNVDEELYSAIAGTGMLLSPGSDCKHVILGGNITAVAGTSNDESQMQRDGLMGVFVTNETAEGVQVTEGNAVIFMSSEIDAGIDKSALSGLIFEGDGGKVYGNPTLTDDVTIPEGKTLTVPTGNTLTIGEDAVLIIDGTILNKGTIVNKGILLENQEIQNGSEEETEKGTITNEGLRIFAPPAGGYDFGTQKEGYSDIAGQKLLENKGKFTLSLPTAANYKLAPQTNEWYIMPKLELKAGNYDTKNFEIGVMKPGSDTADLTFTREVKFTVSPKGGSSSGGSSAAAGGVTNNPADKSTTADLTPTVKDDKSTAGVDEKTGDKIVDKAVEGKSDEVIIDAEGGENASSSEVTIPEKTVKDISEKTDADLVIKTDNGEIRLDKDAVDAAASQVGGSGSLKFIIEVIKSDADINHIKVKIVGANGEITDFRGGNVTVTTKLDKALAEKNLVCAGIDENGLYTKAEGKKNADGNFAITTNGAVSYAVMSAEDAEKIFAEQKAKVSKLTNALELKARSAKTANKNIRVKLIVTKGSIQDIEKLGYTVKYKFYRSTKKSKSYKAALSGKSGVYFNTTGTKNTMYYYKARVMVYDKNGNLVAKTALKQCKYANRMWTK